MAKIHGLVYVIIGLSISIVSWKLKNEKLMSFFYIGLIFVLIGFVKLIFNKIKRKVGKTEKIHKATYQNQRFKYCPKCRTMLNVYDRFCRRCGAKT